MAKIKIRPRPGALSELLKKKGMTQMDAFEKTRVDRKTLSKIDRGEEVKLETLQQVANKLQVTEEFFRHPAAAELTGDDGPEPGTIMLRKIDAARVADLIGDAHRIKWHLNANVPEDEARQFLEDLETAVEKFQAHLLFSPEPEELSLRSQLSRLKAADDVADRLARLAEHRLALLGP
jgi:transcriptional regulator with XRE-family HTH domain